MEQQVVDLVSLGGSVESAELTVWALFLRADIVVKIVMIMLIVASIWCWAVIFEKVRRLTRLRKLADSFEDSFWSGGSLDDLYDRVGVQPKDPMSAVFGAAMREWRRSSAALAPGGNYAALEQRIERVMQVAVGREMDQLERYLPFLASVGSAAPFIGLFGTVWGILMAFREIGAQGSASITVVGPMIAHALIATAVGLAAAIPAVMAYNFFNSRIRVLANEMDNFSSDFLNIVKRHFFK